MKRTTREFGVCIKCKGDGFSEVSFFKGELKKLDCKLCNGTGGILIKETIEESDDMKEFIEKKCGWELCEGIKHNNNSGLFTGIHPYKDAHPPVECNLYCKKLV